MTRPAHARSRPADTRSTALVVLVVLALVTVLIAGVISNLTGSTDAARDRPQDSELTDELGYDGSRPTSVSRNQPGAQRAKQVFVSIEGYTTKQVTTAQTVRDLLVEMGTVIDADHAISHDLDAAATNGDRIVIARITTSTVTEETPIEYATVEVADPTLAQGTKKTHVTGRDGLAVSTFLVRYADGAEVLRTEVLRKVRTEPRDQVIHIGTGGPAGDDPAGTRPTQPQPGQPQPGQPQPTQPTDPKPPSAADREPVIGAGIGPGTTPATARTLARTMASAWGWVGPEFTCLDKLWARESNWNFKAQNPHSTARGIPQTMMNIHFGPDWRTSPQALAYLQTPRLQIEWGLNYIARSAHRGYSTPCEALAFSQANGWY